MPRHRTYRSYRRYSRKGSPETGMALLALILGGGALWLTIHFWFVMLGVAAIGVYVYRVRAPIRAARREAMLNLGNLQRMNGYAFERACAAILQAQGWRVQVTRASGDYGADVVGVAPDGQRWVVQAKRWQKAVGPHAVQEVVAAKAHYGASQALVITTSHFTPAAFTLARDNHVELWDASTLLYLETQRRRSQHRQESANPDQGKEVRSSFLHRVQAWFDRLEDPRSALSYSHQVQWNQLQRVQHEWLTAVSKHAVLQRHLHEAESRIAHLDAQARQAILADRDDVAMARIAALQDARRERNALQDELSTATGRMDTLRQEREVRFAQLSRFRRIRPAIEAAWQAERRRWSSSK